MREIKNFEFVEHKRIFYDGVSSNPMGLYGRYTGNRFAIEIEELDLESLWSEGWREVLIYEKRTLREVSRPIVAVPFGAFFSHIDYKHELLDLVTSLQSKRGRDKLAKEIIKLSERVNWEDIGCAIYGSRFNDPDVSGFIYTIS